MSKNTQATRPIFATITIIGMCSIAGLLHDLWWFFDLFNHFRPQALLATFLLLVIAFLVKDKKSIILAFLVITLNLTLIGDRLYAFPSTNSPHQVSLNEEKIQNISVLFSNVLTSNTQHQPLLNAISNRSPDIIVTTEIDEKWQNGLESIKPDYPFSTVILRSDNFGMAIYSKRPFKSHRYDVGEYKLPLMVLDFDGFTLIAAHPLPPTGSKYAEELHIYMKKISEVAQEVQGSLILVGDLNATLWSDTINHLRDLDLRRTNKLGFAWTWPSGFLPLAVQIDHIFVRDVIMADFEILPEIGSDHFPIKSNITIGAE